MYSLSALIRDLDWEWRAVDSGGSTIYEAFSSAVAHYMHTLIAGDSLTTALQVCLIVYTMLFNIFIFAKILELQFLPFLFNVSKFVKYSIFRVEIFTKLSMLQHCCLHFSL